jgi:predicted nucleic acid-binding protein
VFADSSALVKLYADEPGHEHVRALGGVVVSVLARVEVPAALWRKHRLGELEAADASDLTAAFANDFAPGADERPRFTIVGITDELLEQAAELCGVHGLRAYDAIQLASALAARTTDPGCATLVCFNANLREAAARSELTLLPATLEHEPGKPVCDAPRAR